jgi:hypothetical protein
VRAFIVRHDPDMPTILQYMGIFTHVVEEANEQTGMVLVAETTAAVEEYYNFNKICGVVAKWDSAQAFPGFQWVRYDDIPEIERILIQTAVNMLARAVAEA